VDAGLIRELIRARRLRDELFGPGLFADPAWDILLDLTAARIEGRSVAVSSLCIAAAVPATTALRWIKQLTEAGLLRRVADPDDGRRIFIELTDQAARTMMVYFANAARAGRG
jgi:DNA-binding MarR family transcriptional regulator